MMTTEAGVESQVRELLAEAAAWRLLGLLLERPREGWRDEVDALCQEARDAEAAAADAAREEAGEALYLALLGPGGVISPREVAYRGMEDPGHILSDIKAFYQAFAYDPQAEEPPDHIAVEAGFLGYLCLKEAYARAGGHAENAEVAAQAAYRFRQGHLATLAWSLADRLERTEVRYLSLAARAMALRTGPRPDTAPPGEGPLPPCDDTCPLEGGQRS